MWEIRYYNTVVRPEAMYSAEYMTFDQLRINKLAKIERRILRNTIGPRQTGNEWKLGTVSENRSQKL